MVVTYCCCTYIFIYIIYYFKITIGSSGRLLIVTSKANFFSTAIINLLASSRDIVQSGELSICDQGLFTAMTYPSGTYTLQITGTDTLGSPLSYTLPRSTTFPTGDYDLEFQEPGESSFDVTDSTTLISSLNVGNSNSYPSTFSFTGEMPGFIVTVSPASALIPANGNVSIEITTVVGDVTLIEGSSHTLSVEASNGCSIFNTSKNITLMVSFCQILYLNYHNIICKFLW